MSEIISRMSENAVHSNGTRNPVDKEDGLELRNEGYEQSFTYACRHYTG